MFMEVYHVAVNPQELHTDALGARTPPDQKQIDIQQHDKTLQRTAATPPLLLSHRHALTNTLNGALFVSTALWLNGAHAHDIIGKRQSGERLCPEN